MNISELIGKPVVSMVDGEKVGVVKDVMIDADQLKATAILLGGIPGQGILPFEQVKSVGHDAITIDSAQAIQWATGHLSTAAGRKADELKKLPVMDSSGTALGGIQDIEIDVTTGRLLSMKVGGGGVFGIGGHSTVVGIAQIRAIGPAMITADVPPTDVPASSTAKE